MPSRRGTLKFYRGFNQKANSNLLTSIGTLNGSAIPGLAKQSPEKKGLNGDPSQNNMNGMSAASAYFAQTGNQNANGLSANHQMSGHGGIMS